jgi:hypothetical protein
MRVIGGAGIEDWDITLETSFRETSAWDPSSR